MASPAVILLKGSNCIASDDAGATFNIVSTLPVAVTASCLAAGAGTTFYACDTTSGLRSSNGVDWEATANPFGGTGVINYLLFNGSVLLATGIIGGAQRIASSTDGGVTWSTPVAPPISPIVIAGVIGGTFHLARSDATAASADGVSWGTGAGVAWLNDQFRANTCFDRTRIIASATGDVSGRAITSDGTTWITGGTVPGGGGVPLNEVAMDDDGATVILNDNDGQHTVRSTDGGGSWGGLVNTVGFHRGGAVWTGWVGSFILPLSTVGRYARTIDGGATWNNIDHPETLDVRNTNRAALVLPLGLPVAGVGFWTNFARTQEII